MALQNSEQIINRLVYNYGEELIEYVLNIEHGSESLTELINGDISPSLQQKSAMRTLQRIWKECESWDTAWSRYYELSGVLTFWDQNSDFTVLNKLRQLCGGELEENYEYEPDIILRQCLRLIASAYPVITRYLEKAADREKNCRALIKNLNKEHPARSVFLEALEYDDLKKLFPEGKFESWIWSTGNESTYNKESLVDQLIYAVIDHPEVYFGTTLKSLEAIAREVLADVRKVARGEEIDVPIIAGLSGIKIPGQGSIPIMDDPNSGRPKVWLTNTLKSRMVQRNRPVIDEEGQTCELVWYDQVRLLTTSSSYSSLMEDDFELEIEQGRRRRQQYLDHTRLGIVASHPKSAPRPPVLVEERILSPLGPIGFILGHESERVDVFMESPGRPPGVSHLGWLVLKHDDLEKIKAICALFLHAASNKSLALAARRLCLSLGIRNDPEDRLIDAVISAEALVGGTEKNQKHPRNSPQEKKEARKSKSEVFAEALAKLVYPEKFDLENQLKDDLLRIIGLRGRVVHGSGRKVDTVGSSQLTMGNVADAGAKLSKVLIVAFFQIVQDHELSTSDNSIQRQKIILDRQKTK